MGLFRALVVWRENIPTQQQSAVIIVQQTLPLQLAVSLTLRVNVTLGSRGKMETHARCAVSINTNQAWDWLIALFVHQIPSQQLAAPQIPLVSATPGMEARARSAVSTNTKLA